MFLSSFIWMLIKALLFLLLKKTSIVMLNARYLKSNSIARLKYSCTLSLLYPHYVFGFGKHDRQANCAFNHRWLPIIFLWWCDNVLLRMWKLKILQIIKLVDKNLDKVGPLSNYLPPPSPFFKHKCKSICGFPMMYTHHVSLAY